MLSLQNIFDTIDMIDKQHLDIRTITMGISLLDCVSEDAVQSASGDSQQLLADYYIGIRGAWLKESASLLENSETLWANLTAGAVSTAGEGH